MAAPGWSLGDESALSCWRTRICLSQQHWGSGRECNAFRGIAPAQLCNYSRDVKLLLLEKDMSINFTMLSNNLGGGNGLINEWGLSCLIETEHAAILFDTGQTGPVLLSNMKAKGKSPENVDVVFLSHVDYDHIGGLEDFLAHARRPLVCLPKCFSNERIDSIAESAGAVRVIEEPEKITSSVYSTGEMPGLRNEHGLVLHTGSGLILITGCAHPGVVEMVERAKSIVNDDVYMVLGGFHYKDSASGVIERDIARLKQLGVKKTAPSHCTGEIAVAMFKDAWRENFISFGCGAQLTLDLQLA